TDYDRCAAGAGAARRVGWHVLGDWAGEVYAVLAYRGGFFGCAFPGSGRTIRRLNTPEVVALMSWTLSQRAQKLTSSAIREILKVTERPEVISFAGGLPSPDTFPVERLRTNAAAVLSNDP